MKTKIQHLVGAILLSLPLWIVLGGITITSGVVPALLVIIYVILMVGAVWMGLSLQVVK